MNFSFVPGHRPRRHRTSWRDVISVELTSRVSSGGDIMKGTFLIWKLLCFTYILALVRPVPEKIPIGKPYFLFGIRQERGLVRGIIINMQQRDGG
ncbi:uncharacterized protein CDAR_168081 [Caerostris darwini]|uniref:Uncharacterized protein n=1 Tax=Caerostris darwini TaxID=1538125 RepID=A0AAV4VIU0_9ARAC|nr:uncharacterized protein CDAR_168081 [Caerostris darwini]